MRAVGFQPCAAMRAVRAANCREVKIGCNGAANRALRRTGYKARGHPQIYSLRKARVWRLVISNGLRHRIFVQESLSSRRTI